MAGRATRQQSHTGKRPAEDELVEELKNEINSKIQKVEDDVRRQQDDLTENLNDANKNIQAATLSIQAILERLEAIEKKVTGSYQENGQDGTGRAPVLKKKDLVDQKIGIRE